MAGALTASTTNFPTFTTPQWYPVTLVNGTTAAIAGVANQHIRVYKIILAAASTVSATFLDGGNAFTGAMPYTGMALDLSDTPFICSAGNNFNITCTGNSGGTIFASIGT